MTWEKIAKGSAALAGGLAGLMGAWSAPMTALAAFMVIDYVTGVIVAWRGRSPKSEGGGVSSKAGFDGLIRKAFILAVILVAALLDEALGGTRSVFRTAAALYYAANEAISILENAALMGVPCPAFIRSALEAMREKGDRGEKEE